MQKEQSPHLLLVEDEVTLGYFLKERLKLSGYSINLCRDGEEGWNTFRTGKFDLCILDVNMPKKSGYELAKDIRGINPFVPIIFLTANSAEEDRLKGFELGADEYIVKPFSTDELVARIKAILRRSQYAPPVINPKEEIKKIGNLEVDFINHCIKINGSEKRMSTTEAELFKLFVDHKNNLLTRNSILINVWGRDDYYTARNLDVYINKLRKILKEDPLLEIVNIHGAGFKLVENIANQT
ncbi:MAG: response regulator transcription factor [Bacteroidota bacterium]|jgi:DNA-binding response OmpR family regulator